MKNTIARNSVEGKQADCGAPLPANLLFLRCVSSGVRADMARSLQSRFLKRKDTCSISAPSPAQSPPPLSKQNWRFCVDAGFFSGFFFVVFNFPLVLPHDPDSKRKV